MTQERPKRPCTLTLVFSVADDSSPSVQDIFSSIRFDPAPPEGEFSTLLSLAHRILHEINVDPSSIQKTRPN